MPGRAVSTSPTVACGGAQAGSGGGECGGRGITRPPKPPVDRLRPGCFYSISPTCLKRPYSASLSSLEVASGSALASCG